MENLEIVEIIRKIVENEIRKLHIAEIGEVTSVFPHSSDSDKNNYECNVKLKYRDLELRKVPVATQQIGLANIPHVGDLVLINFINGSINAPVLVGRLYTDDDRPPLSKEEEIVYIPPYSENPDLQRIHMEFPGGMVLSVKDDIATIKANKTTLTLKRDGNVEIRSRNSVRISGGDIVLSANNIKMKGKKSIELESEEGTMSFKSQRETEIESKQGELSLKAFTRVGIESTYDLDIKSDVNASLEAGGPLKIKGTTVHIN